MVIYVNDMIGEVVIVLGIIFFVWSINGDCLVVVNIFYLVVDIIFFIISFYLLDWMEVSWYVVF